MRYMRGRSNSIWSVSQYQSRRRTVFKSRQNCCSEIVVPANDSSTKISVNNVERVNNFLKQNVELMHL